MSNLSDSADVVFRDTRRMALADGVLLRLDARPIVDDGLDARGEFLVVGHA